MSTKREREKRESRRTSAKSWADNQDRSYISKALRLPEGIQLYSLSKKEGKILQLNFLRYIAGKGNPNSDEGFEHWERTYYVHKGIGPDEDTYACPNKNAGKRCPVCEYISKHRDNEELWNVLRPKQRHLFAILDLKDKDRGVQILETAYYKSFGELLKEEIDSIPEDKQFPDDYTTQCRIKEDSYLGKKYNKISKIDLVQREEGEVEISKVPCLDDMIYILPYEKLDSIFKQNPMEDEGGEPNKREQESEKPKHEVDMNGSGKEPKTDGFNLKEGMKVKYDDEVHTIKKIRENGTLLDLEDEDGDITKGVNRTDIAILDKDPNFKIGTKGPDDDEWDDEDDETDDENEDDEDWDDKDD